MKKTIFILSILCLMVSGLFAQNIPAGDNVLLDKFIQSRYSLKKERIISDTLAKVISGNLYLITATYTDNSTSGNLMEARIGIKDGKLVEFEDLSTNKKLTGMFSLARKDFFLRTENDAKIFESVIEKFYPLGWSNEKYRQHLKKDGKWYFVRGEFFENKEAIIVTLDASQRISDISFALDALKK